MTVTDLIPSAGLAATGALLAIWRSSAVMEVKMAAMKNELERDRKDGEKTETSLTHDLRDALKQLNALVTDVKVIGTSQAVINQTVTSTLLGVAGKLENHDKMLTEHAATLSLIRELLTTRKPVNHE